MQIGEGVVGGGDGSGGGRTSGGRERAVLEVGFFFDGTLNHREHALGGPDGSYANAVSNVGLLYPLYRTDRSSSEGRVVSRRSEYLPGIGTTDGLDDAFDAALGTGNTGVSARVHRACELLARHARSGRYDEIVVDAFGFSRGAAAARYFVNCVNRRSFEAVTTGEIADHEPTQLARVELPAATVRFLGIFDTVAAVADSRHPSVSDADNLDVNVHLRDGSARAIYHLVAENEYRENFALNSIRTSSGAVPAGGFEHVVPGAHSDVGGGYAGEGETVIPVRPESTYYATRAEAEAGRTSARAAMAEFRQRVQREHFAPESSEGFSVRMDHIEHSDIGDGQPYRYGGFLVWTRAVRPGLEKIALRLMHHRAVDNQVPLRAVPSDAAHAVPDDIQRVGDVLRSGGSVEGADLASLRTHYVHWSAHYGNASGMNPAAFDTGFYADVHMQAPADHFRRIVHPNDPGAAW